MALSAIAAPALASTAAPQLTRQATTAIPTVTPATSADTTSTGPATMAVTIDNVDLHCFTPGIVYEVNANGDHIRSLPNGSFEASIAKGRWFDSEIDINGAGPYHCITDATIAGQYWVYGYPNYDTLITGYMGLNYLTFVKYVS